MVKLRVKPCSNHSTDNKGRPHYKTKNDKESGKGRKMKKRRIPVQEARRSRRESETKRGHTKYSSGMIIVFLYMTTG